jgi:hypothetical protein
MSCDVNKADFTGIVACGHTLQDHIFKPFVAIRSNSNYYAQRAACEDTWVPELPWPFVFFSDAEVNHEIPQRVYFNTGPLRRNLPKKTHLIYDWFLRNTDYTHMFLVGDSNYVAVDRLVAATPQYVDKDYVGFVLKNDKGQVWIDDGAMWVSRKAAQIIVDDGSLLTQEREDVDVATADILRGKVTFCSDERYGWRLDVCLVPQKFNAQISVKMHSPEGIRFLHNAYKTSLETGRA